jgi:lipopolysaccharide/colanic/teichoic acid biosynthesis glycosyltransferase
MLDAVDTVATGTFRAPHRGRLIRRSLDVVASASGLLLLSPVFAVLAAAVKLSSSGPIFHRAKRVGRDGRHFTMYKFRSMRLGEGGSPLTRADDPRITGTGRLLRRTKLDELPQLINVLKGDMSLVGPRPESPRYVALYDDEQRRILSARPGITSPASLLYGPREEQMAGHDWEQVYVETIMPAKLRVDLDYIDRRSVASDWGVILSTITSLARSNRA